MLSSLSVQLFQLSDDPTDVAWGRWLWAQEGAKPLPFMHAFGSAVWEDQRTPERVGPQIPLQPARYRPARISLYPGQSFHGEAEWYETGLPLDQRECEQEYVHCGVQQWNTETTYEMDCEGSGLEVLVPLLSTGGDADAGAARFGPLSPEIVGSGFIGSGVGFHGTFRYPAGEVGDLLLMLDRTFGPPDIPVTVPPGWELLFVGDESAEQRRLCVAFQYRTSPDAAIVFYGPQTTFHEGYIACMRGAGLPWEMFSAVGVDDTAVYPPVAGPPGDHVTVFRALGAVFGSPETPTVPDGYFLWPLQGDTDHEPTVFAKYDVQGLETGGTAQIFHGHPWGTLSVSVPHTNYVGGRGGDGDGGEATTWASLELTGQGGDGDGGEATTWASLELTGQGGDGDGGEAVQGGGLLVTGTGGDADTGTGEIEEETMIGEIRMWSAGPAPDGWVECVGQALDRTTYADLFAVIGSLWGDGDGSTTFNLPDLRGRVPVGVGQGTGLTDRVMATTGGAETHVLSVAEMPAHRHDLFTAGGGAAIRLTPDALGSGVATDFPLMVNKGGGGGHANMQPFAVVAFIIKY